MSTSSIPVESLQLIYTIQHPCHVVNSDRAIETLGGRQRLVDVFTHSTTSQLTCSFTPSNIYERPLRADRQKTTGLLIRVRRNKQTKTVKSVHVIGILDTSYSFESLADFQYLPMIKKNDQYESFLPRVALNRQCLDKENLERPCPLMCIPAIFSRFFDPTDYAFRPEPKARPKRAATTITRSKQAINSHKLTKRNVRSSAAHHIGFDATTVPRGPKSSNDLYTNVDQSTITHLRRLFEQRPVWTRNSLLYHLKITEVILKRIIHHIAYFFCNGPWNRCWVKYAYDPRSDPKSKIYQIVDYRVRAILDPEKISSNREHQEPIIDHRLLIPGQISTTATTISALNTKNYAEEMYMFKTTSLPVARSIHYQLIDIQLDEVQQMVHSNDGQEQQCSESDGWCVADYQNRAREMMSAAHEQLYRHYQREREQNVTADDDDDESQQLEDEEEEEDEDDDVDDQDEESNEEADEDDEDVEEDSQEEA